MKRPIVRNLPLGEEYHLLESFHTGGIENAQCCANCGRPIVEVAVLGDAHGNRHSVGMDCADTLVRPIDRLEYLQQLDRFAAAKSMAALLRKAFKATPTGVVSTHFYGAGTGGYYSQGGFTVQFGGPDTPGYFFRNLPVALRPYVEPVIRQSSRTAVVVV